jgi:hypothetical protein
MDEALKLSDRGEVIEPDLHDANLTAIIVEETEVVLRFVQEDGRRMEVIARGARQLHCDDFNLGNIILDATLQFGRELSSDDVSWLWCCYGSERDKYREFVMSEEDQARPSLILTPSYGASLILLADAFTWRDIGPR